MYGAIIHKKSELELMDVQGKDAAKPIKWIYTQPVSCHFELHVFLTRC